MAYLTEAQAIAAFEGGRATRQFVETELRKSASSPLSTPYDVFLSHSVLDARVIVGVKALMEAEGLRVYVDWSEDPHLDRTHVTTTTAATLRERMRHSNSMVFATSSSSSRSIWMPWELGYFDGFRPGKVAILPLVNRPNDDYVGQEYLGLYPKMEAIEFNLGGQHLGIRESDNSAQRIQNFAAAT
jgi:hypothetical protein